VWTRRRSEILQPHNERREPQEHGGTEIREHLANERTLLSWVRTGVSLISIGLVVERAAALVDASMKVGSTSASELFGLALVPPSSSITGAGSPRASSFHQ
jgi:uncharacterized membrane protein YidH (DUF202 family)